MWSYCVECRKKADYKNPKSAKTNKGKLMIICKCSVRLKRLRFIKEWEDSAWSSSLGRQL